MTVFSSMNRPPSLNKMKEHTGQKEKGRREKKEKKKKPERTREKGGEK